MAHYTWITNRQKLFRSIERAADYAVKNCLEPREFRVLRPGGKTAMPDPWELTELKIQMRDRGRMVW